MYPQKSFSVSKLHNQSFYFFPMVGQIHCLLITVNNDKETGHHLLQKPVCVVITVPTSVGLIPVLFAALLLEIMLSEFLCLLR